MKNSCITVVRFLQSSYGKHLIRKKDTIPALIEKFFVFFLDSQKKTTFMDKNILLKSYTKVWETTRF